MAQKRKTRNLTLMAHIKIGKRTVGDGHPAYVIAEAGVNHNGSLARAKDLIKKAAQSGADAIKFQTYKADKLVTKAAPRFWDWAGEKKKKGTQHDSYSLLDGFPMAYYPTLIKECKKHGIEFLSTPFDEESADALVKFGMKAIKVSSSDVTNLPFLTHLAKHKLPILLSVGASTMGEIEEAVRTIEQAGNTQILIMQCTLIYPTPFEHAHIRVIPTLARVFPQYPIGLSDHTLGTHIPPAAVALGATLIEKHYTVDKKLGVSADHWLSVDPKDLKEMIEAIRHVELALGSNRKVVLAAEKHTYLYDKRSVVSARPIKKGQKITKDMLTHKRPGTGIRPKFRDIVVGRIARQDIPADTTLTWDLV